MILRIALALMTLIVLPAHEAIAQKPLASRKSSREVLRQQTVAQAVAFLKNKGQAEDGSFFKAGGTGVTSLVATSLIRNGLPLDDPTVSRSLKYVEGFVQKSGGIHQPMSLYQNYETSLAVLLFTEANSDDRYDKTIRKADAFLKNIQWDEGEGRTKSDFDFGGGGYGKHARPDLSNTAFLIEALRAAGNDENSEALQRALLFVSRSQNLETPHNQTPHAAKNPDGGFYYTPAAGGSSQAGTTANGGLRSYASMTYAGLKSMIYAGVKPDDPRVKAASEWISKNYDLKTNPGLGDSGLYYYYHTFAKALDAVGSSTVIDDEGQKHDWRAELIAELARRQKTDGSWTNDNQRWLEGEASLVTGYALLALSYCK